MDAWLNIQKQQRGEVNMLTFALLKQLVASATIANAAEEAEVVFHTIGPVDPNSFIPIENKVEVKKVDVSIVINENGQPVTTVTQVEKVIFIQG